MRLQALFSELSRESYVEILQFNNLTRNRTRTIYQVKEEEGSSEVLSKTFNFAEKVDSFLYRFRLSFHGNVFTIMT